MKIKEPPKVSKGKKSYLKWAGLLPPKLRCRLGQLNKFNRRMRKANPSEFILAAIKLEGEGAD